MSTEKSEDSGVDQERSTTRTESPASDQIEYDRAHLRNAYAEWSEESKWRERLADAIDQFIVYQPLIHSISGAALSRGSISLAQMSRLQRAAARMERVLRGSDKADARKSVEDCLCHLPKCTWHANQRHISDEQVRCILNYCKTGEVDDRPRFESAIERLRETLPRVPAVDCELAVDPSRSSPNHAH